MRYNPDYSREEAPAQPGKVLILNQSNGHKEEEKYEIYMVGCLNRPADIGDSRGCLFTVGVLVRDFLGCEVFCA